LIVVSCLFIFFFFFTYIADAYHRTEERARERDTTTDIVDMGPPLEEWDRDLELEEKRTLPGWCQTHEQFNRIGHRQYAPNNPRRQTTVPTTNRLLRGPAGSENDRLREIARIFEHKSHQAFEQQRRFWRPQYSSTKFNRYSTSEAPERYNYEDIGRLSRRMPPIIIAEIWSYLEMNSITDYNSEQSEIAILAARRPLVEISLVRYDMLPAYGKRHLIEMSLMKTHKKENLQATAEAARYAIGGNVLGLLTTTDLVYFSDHYLTRSMSVVFHLSLVFWQLQILVYLCTSQITTSTLYIY
jgi:hypothetical protein